MRLWNTGITAAYASRRRHAELTIGVRISLLHPPSFTCYGVAIDVDFGRTMYSLSLLTYPFWRKEIT